MSTANLPATLPPRPLAMPSASASAPSGAGSALATLDPFRLLAKYKWVIAAAVVAGVVLGVGAFVLLGRFAPSYRAFVLFEATPPPTNMQDPVGTQNPEVNAFASFMATQTNFMTSDLVLQSVAEDPRLAQAAPRYAAGFMENGVVAVNEVLRDLRDRVRSRVVAETRLLELSMSWRTPEDTTAVLGLVKQRYMNVLRENDSRDKQQQRDALNDQIRVATTTITNLTSRRDQLISQHSLTTLDQAADEASTDLTLVNSQRIESLSALAAMNEQLTRFERDLAAPVVVYPESIREEVENGPALASMKQTLDYLHVDRQSLLQKGFPPTHRTMRDLDSRIEGMNQRIDEARERALRQRFEAMVDTMRTQISGIQASLTALDQRRDTLARRLQDMASVRAQLIDLERQVEATIGQRAGLQDSLAQLTALSALDQSQRVLIRQDERLPRERAFPKLAVVVPAVVVLVTGLTLGLILVRELLDQRVKSPSDVAVIPRTRVLGWVPDASEDFEGSGAVETAFRDRPKGAIAESYRALRAVVLKRLGMHDHRALVVLAGMPGSGATSVVSNLALAAAATDMRVLAIDANFRRPALHRVLGVSEAPGLADVLAGEKTIAQTVQHAKGGVDVLSAGSSALRVFERLSSPALGAVLAQAKADYDLVIFDVAPAIVSGDGLSLAARCDATVLVVRALAEKRGMVARIKNDLSDSRAEFLGVIVNGVHAAAGGYMRRNIRASQDYLNGKQDTAA